MLAQLLVEYLLYMQVSCRCTIDWNLNLSLTRPCCSLAEVLPAHLVPELPLLAELDLSFNR